jgi:hypothetical protein
MKLLSSPKTTYLLEADIEVLHEESQEWLNEIRFWRDELAFFYTLMIKKSGLNIVRESKDEVVHLLDEILHLSGKEFGELETAIKQHENYLASLMETNSLSNDRDFREKHKNIFFLVDSFDKRMKKLKSGIFLLVKKNNS